MTEILIDTYAWIEIFRDSLWGRKALACIEKSPSCFVSALTLYELQYRLIDLYGNQKTGSLLATILAHNDVISIDKQIAIAAGSIKAEQKRLGTSMGAVDCLILATARIHRLKILTGDRHFTGLEETIDV
jgi:predicted nucleic acid-binding protein